ncbi:MAG: alpha/beta hydrolase [Bacteroidota bacterium]
MNQYINFRGKKIHYTADGKGEAIVLVHGFTESLAIWNEFSKRLSENYQVVCIDLPGHGLSDCVAEIHTMELMAECVVTILESLKINKSVIVGHSMGGYVSLAFAEKFSEMLKGLCLFHSSAYADNSEVKQNRYRTNEVIKEHHQNFLSSFIPSLFAPKNQEKYASEIAALVDSSKKMSADGVIACNCGMAKRSDRCHVLKNLKIPVLFIAGKLDSRIPFDKVLEQIAMPNDTVALLLGDIAHMGYIEAKEKTYYAVKTFVDGCF